MTNIMFKTGEHLIEFRLKSGKRYVTLRSVLQLRLRLTKRDSSNMSGQNLKTNPRTSDLGQRDGTMATDSAAKAEVLNKFFTSVLHKKTRKDYPHLKRDLVQAD